MANKNNADPRSQRLPWSATAAALVAFGALAWIGGVTIVLPLLAVGLLATYGFAARIPPGQWWLHWLLRFALYGIVIFLNGAKPDEGLADSLLAAPAMDTVGQLAGAELVIQAWLRQPSRPPAAVSMILLSGVTLIAACQTMDPRYPRLFVPPYLFLALVSLSGRRGYSSARILAVASAVIAGAGTYGETWTHRAEISEWAAHVIDGQPVQEATGLSEEPILSDTFRQRGSARRVLRITGLTGITYLRGISFEDYRDGRWDPPPGGRPYAPASPNPRARGPRARFTPVSPTDGVLPVPLNAAGVDPLDNDPPKWSTEFGGPLQVTELQPATYDVILGPDPYCQGPFATPLSPDERTRCLAVSAEIDPRVHALARTIAGDLRVPREKIRAISGYLMSHHGYSLSYSPGDGDPISDFLLQSPPAQAHCAFFAASAVTLLRCVGVPARYVVGYYAHESDGDGVISVRQRDAHAWAEAWVEGTGWMTVDATPSDGRPDADHDSVPFWQRLSEWVADHGWPARPRLPTLAQVKRVLGTAGVVVMAALLGLAYRRRGAASLMRDADPTFMPTDADLAALAGRYEALLLRCGIPCPPTRTWDEHLRFVDRGMPSARTFVAAYNHARFGGATAIALERLTELYAEAERALQGDTAEEEA